MHSKNLQAETNLRTETGSDDHIRVIESVTVYLDEQDQSDIGWVFRAEYNDGHQESGSVDCPVKDKTGLILDALHDVVKEHGGDWKAGGWEYSYCGSGSYRWSI